MKVSARMQIRSLSYKPAGPRIFIRDTTENVMSQYVYEFIHVYKYSYIKFFYQEHIISFLFDLLLFCIKLNK